MNHETAVAMAVVLAVIVMTIIYSMISGGLNIGEQGVGNITERAEDDSTGRNLDFVSLRDMQNLTKSIEEHESRDAGKL